MKKASRGERTMRCTRCDEYCDDDDDDGSDDSIKEFEYGVDGYGTWVAGLEPEPAAKAVERAIESAQAANASKDATADFQVQHACRVLAR